MEFVKLEVKLMHEFELIQSELLELVANLKCGSFLWNSKFVC